MNADSFKQADRPDGDLDVELDLLLSEAKWPDADTETLGVSKFRAEYYQKSAQMMNKKEWGNEKDSGASGITVVVQRGLTAEVTQGSTGGVLTIGPEQNKGYPVSGVTVDG